MKLTLIKLYYYSFLQKNSLFQCYTSGKFYIRQKSIHLQLKRFFTKNKVKTIKIKIKNYLQSTFITIAIKQRSYFFNIEKFLK